jgi:Zn finger protein HypA/HybF involved in hydrogenase expression
MLYFDKLVVIECTQCGQNRKVTDRYAKFVEDNNVKFVCDVCKGVRPAIY